MNNGRTIFSQLIEYLTNKEFRKCVSHYRGDHYVKRFSCWDQFLSMAFAQLTYRDGLRDIEACLQSVGSKLYHMGFRSEIKRSTLADANELRDSRIYDDFAQLFTFELCSAFFVVRTKDNVLLQRRYSRPVDKSTGLRSDHTVVLATPESSKAYPDPLRRVTFVDQETNKRLKFLTNNFA